MVMTMRMCFAVALLLFYFNMHDLDTKLQTGRTRYNILCGAVASVSSAAGRILGGSSSKGSRNKRHRTVAACADIDDTGEDNESSEDTTINEKLASFEVENESLRKMNITLNQKLVVANDKKIALDDAVDLVANAINKELDDPATLASQTASKQFSPAISAAYTDKGWLRKLPATTKRLLSVLFPRKNHRASYRTVATTDHMSVDPDDSNNSSDLVDTPDDYDNDDEEDAGRKRWAATAAAA